MQSGAITLDTADGPMRTYESLPDGEPRGGLVVIMEAFGVNDHIEDVTRRAATAGYHALAPDLFHRSGGGTAAYGDFAKVIELFAGVTDETVLADVDSALDRLRNAGFGDERIGVVGFCFGGRATFLLAARRRLGAAVGFYGGGIVEQGGLPFPALIDEVADVDTPWLGLFGDLDQSIPAAHVERLRAELAEQAPAPTEIVRYPDAGHGFHCDGRPDDFRPADAADAWARALAWFERHLQ